MSAVVCGKRSLFDDLHGTPPITKRLRCGGNSPIRFSSSASGSSRSSSPSLSDSGIISSALAVAAQELRILFPEMEEQVLEKVLESCGNNLESAIKRLSSLRLSSVPDSQPKLDASGSLLLSNPGEPPISSSRVLENSLPSETASSAATEGTEWVEHLVQEMRDASDLEDAQNRAARALEAFEKNMSCRLNIVLEAFQRENGSLKEQLQGILRDNQILKRAVAIQHERQLDYSAKSQELQQLRELIVQYQEQLRSLEIKNYALTLHLRKAQEGTSIPGHFHPDVF